jgi:hypothetical protein
MRFTLKLAAEYRSRKEQVLLKYCISLAAFSSMVIAAGLVAPSFQQIQPETFSASGAYTSAWADFDNDGDLDLFVGFAHDIPNRLYRNDHGTFADVAAGMGLADQDETRAAAWGRLRR